MARTHRADSPRVPARHIHPCHPLARGEGPGAAATGLQSPAAHLSESGAPKRPRVPPAAAGPQAQARAAHRALQAAAEPRTAGSRGAAVALAVFPTQCPPRGVWAPLTGATSCLASWAGEHEEGLGGRCVCGGGSEALVQCLQAWAAVRWQHPFTPLQSSQDPPPPHPPADCERPSCPSTFPRSRHEGHIPGGRGQDRGLSGQLRPRTCRDGSEQHAIPTRRTDTLCTGG